ncbi:hypothetical protein E1265_32235 [Streptomyces sp. 8K308]|uniref:type IV secretory system conjugative DNA transfer family protein n=1 Tax=Streptomyces sp. 8K308 TaxID=2530388 RepID=UPI00105127F5|nr:type IV secretory system conjugative DNA transfer family protein [Streptomyces sp. 8K308]TDC09411.1 hypothetical protein E1265_32235 [Streptomyces sp. 8K308]
MTTDTNAQQQRRALTPEIEVGRPERAVALGSIFAPAAVTAAMPILESSASFGLTLATGGYLTLATAAYTQQISARVLEMIPGGDILHGHRSTLMLSSALTTSGLVAGLAGGDAGSLGLLLGFLDVPSVEGLASLTWWGATGILPLKLRKVLARRGSKKQRKKAGPKLIPGMSARERDILLTWAHFASDGPAKDHVMTLRVLRPDRWEAAIVAPKGKPVQVRAEAISALYEVPLDQVEILTGAHAGECLVIVHAQPRAAVTQQTPSGIKGLWELRVAKAGVLPRSYVDDVQARDGVTGLIIRANEDAPSLAQPNVYDLAGALRTRPSLLAYTPTTNPRVGHVLLMDRNPLQDKRPITSAADVAMSASGRMALGMMATGRKAVLQLVDRALGALHVAVVGTTGAGKGGVIQLICLGVHVAGSAIIYADPKGSSNPTVEDMAAYSAGGPDDVIKALRVANAVLDHRIEESKATKTKNFTPTPERPHILVVVDEAPEILNGGEGAYIASRLSRLGRSVGMSLLIASQTMLADLIGGSEVRQQIIGGGTLIFLRVAKEVVSLAGAIPEKFKTVDPSQIPISWSADEDEEQIFYDETQEIPEHDRTYGLGYIADHTTSPQMFRASDMEDAAPYLSGIPVTHPADVPWWHDVEALAAIENTVVKKKATVSDDEGGAGFEPGYEPGEPGLSLLKEPTARERVLAGLTWLHREMGDIEDGYPVKEIEFASKVAGQTLQNVLGDLTKAGDIIRVKKGHYALPPSDDQD